MNTEEIQLQSDPNVPNDEITSRNSEDDKPILNWWLYLVWIYFYSFSNVLFGATTTTINLFYPSYKNYEFGWDDDEGAKYLSFLSSGNILGLFLSGTVLYFLKNLSPHLIMVICKIFIVLSYLSMVTGIIEVMIVSRFVEGFCIGIIASYSIGCIYEMGYGSHRARLLVLQQIMLVCGILFTLGLSFLDTGSRVIWRIYYIILAAITVIDLLLYSCFLKGTDSIAVLFRRYGKEHTSKILRNLFSNIATQEKLALIENQIKLEDQEIHGNESLFKVYSYEFRYGIFVSFLMAAVFLEIFNIESMIFLTTDINDTDEVMIAKVILTGYAILEVTLKFIDMYFEFHSKRKRYMLIGLTIFVFAWALMAFSYYIENVWVSRLAGFFIYVGISVVLVTCFIYLGEVCPPSLIGICLSVYYGLSALQTLIAPYIFKNNAPSINFVLGCLGLSGFVLITTIFSCFYLIETHGFERNQIYNRLRGLKIDEVTRFVKPVKEEDVKEQGDERL